MSYRAMVLYPNKDDTVFNMKYYRANHLPLVEKKWKSQGLLKWELVEAGPGPDGQKQQFGVICVLTWKDRESWTAASTGPDVSEIMDDVPNFSNYGPVFVSGELIASG